MPALAPFTPGATVTLAVTNATGSVALPSTAGDQIRVQNTGAKLAFIKFGTSSSVTAATTDFPIQGPGIQTLTKPNTATYVAAICGGADTTTLYFTAGDGQ